MAFKKSSKRSTRRRPANKRRPKRQAKRGRNFNVSQAKTVNPQANKPMVFTKTALYIVNGTNVMNGTGLGIAQLGGALPASMPDWGSITNLFNRYKMLKVTYTFNLTTTTQTNGLDGDRLPKIMIRYNYDSNLTSSGILNKFQELPDTKQLQFTADKTQMTYSYYPRCIEPVYLSGISTGYKLARQQYIDVQYGTVPHYGIMWYVDFLTTGLAITYDITYKVAFKYEA